MSRKYTPRPRSAIWYGDWNPAEDRFMPESMTIYEREKDRPTGVLDRHGNEFFASDEEPLGFDVRCGASPRGAGG